MAVASLYPAIKPSLLLDFANTKKLDPRVTFTRSTTAAYYDGVTTAKAEENLLLNSVSPANSSWNYQNGYAGSLGSELVTNGTFDTDTDWAKGTGWSIAAGVATYSGNLFANRLTQIYNGQNNKTYLVRGSFTMANTPSSNAQVNINTGGIGQNVVSSSAFSLINGNSYTINRSATPTSVSSGFVVQISSNLNYQMDFDLDDVSVKEIIADSVTAPDGTSTASTFTADAADATFTQSVSVVAGEYTFSVYLRRVTGTGDVDIQCGGGTWVTQSITSSWARYTVTQTLTAGTRTPGIRIVTSGDQVEIWGAQLEQRSSVTAYTPTTTQPITNYIPVLLTAPANVPRFDHNPVTEESLGLLIEEQRTNLLLRSNDFADAYWTKTRSSIASNTVIAPDGTLTGDKLVEDTSASTTHLVGRSVTVVSATVYTVSVYLKAAERTWASVRISSLSNSNCWFDLAAGVVGTQQSAATATITPVGNGWYRCTVTGTSTSTSGGVEIYAATGDSVIDYTGDGWSGIYIWGAQFEASSFSTSYIPTTSATVTRNADAASMIGSNFSSWYNQAEGTLYIEAKGFAAPSTSTFQVDDGTTTNRIVLTNASSPLTGALVIVSGVTQADAIASFTSGYNRNILAYSYNDFAAYLSGASYLNDTSGILPVVSEGRIGSNTLGSSCQSIKKIAYYPQRLTNANLQALTT